MVRLSTQVNWLWTKMLSDGNVLTKSMIHRYNKGCLSKLCPCQKLKCFSNITKLMVPESAGSGKFLMSFLLYEDEKYSKPMSLNPSLEKEWSFSDFRIFEMSKKNFV